MKKTQRGITLIALIITIIVLLILAVVTIGSIKESGIIDRAKQAALQTEIAQIKEAFELKNAEELLKSKIDKTNSTGFTLNDLDISDNLKTKYASKLTISDGKLYYLPGLTHEEIEYMERQGITALPQPGPGGSDPTAPDPNDSTFKAAVKTAVRNTTKTGDYYNLITIMNTVKQSYPKAVGLVLKDDFNGDAANPISEEMFGYLVDGTTTILLKNGDEEIEVSLTGNITDYNGNVVLMYDLDAMNEFGLKRISEGKLEVVSYKGTNPDIVVPTAIYDDKGTITAAIEKISTSAFVKSVETQPDPISVLTFAGIDETTYRALNVSQLFSGLGLSYTGPETIATSSEDTVKLRALYELFLAGTLGANTTASLVYDENLIPSMFATLDGAEVNFTKRTTNVDITSVTLPVYISSIENDAFKDQTTLTSVILPVGAGPKISTSAFSGCTNLTRIDFNVANSSVSASEITAISGFSTRWGAPEKTKIYLNGTPLN